LIEENNVAKKTTACQRCLTENPVGNLFCAGCVSPLRTHWPGNYKAVYYADGEEAIPGEIKPYLMPQVMGEVCKKMMPNGDFICQIEEVRKGVWNPVRALPPKAY
jgi:hypothetical protein